MCYHALKYLFIYLFIVFKNFYHVLSFLRFPFICFNPIWS